MQQIEPQISEKYELEYRNKPKFIETFGTFRPSAFCCKEENRHLFNLNVCSKLNLFDWDRDGGTQASTTGETLIWKPRWFKTDPSVRFRTSRFFCKNQKKNYSIESSTTTLELSTDLLIGETKPVATQKIKFEDSFKSVSKPVFGTLVQSGFWWMKKTDYFLIDWFVTTPENSTGILMQQVRPKKLLKIEFEHRFKSNFIAPTGILGPSGFGCKEKNRHLFNPNVCSKMNYFDWDLKGRN